MEVYAPWETGIERVDVLCPEQALFDGQDLVGVDVPRSRQAFYVALARRVEVETGLPCGASGDTGTIPRVRVTISGVGKLYRVTMLMDAIQRCYAEILREGLFYVRRATDAPPYPLVDVDELSEEEG